MEKQLITARQRIAELCETVNTLDRLRGGNGRKVRVEDYLEGLNDSPVPSISRPMGEILGPVENIGSTTRDKPAPFLPPLFSE